MGSTKQKSNLLFLFGTRACLLLSTRVVTETLLQSRDAVSNPWQSQNPWLAAPLIDLVMQSFLRL